MLVALVTLLFSFTLSQDWNLQLLSKYVADGAACLDGSPPAYYFRPGKDTGSLKWFLIHEGGGWCTSLQDCLGRSKTILGSSKTYGPIQTDNVGYYSNDSTINPLMYNWNMVHFKYCDGASFSGNNDTVTNVDGTNLYFRGWKNQQAYLMDLSDNHMLQKGTDFVISGCSAGGLAAYLHVDWWAENLPAASKVRGMPDSGFFLDYDSTFAPKYGRDMRWVFHQQNVTSGVNQRCIAGHSTSDPSDCMFAEHTVPFLKTPIFPLQSRYDSWQVGNILGSQDPASVNNYGDLFVTRFSVMNTGGNGYFFDSCYHHCGEWDSIRITGDLSGKALDDWYNGADSGRYTQTQPYPCSTCCTP